MHANNAILPIPTGTYNPNLHLTIYYILFFLQVELAGTKYFLKCLCNAPPNKTADIILPHKQNYWSGYYTLRILAHLNW